MSNTLDYSARLRGLCFLNLSGRSECFGEFQSAEAFSKIGDSSNIEVFHI